MVDNKQLWENALIELELSVSRANFNTWFKNTFISKHDSGIVYLCVPNAFVKDWLSAKYHRYILKALRTHTSTIRSIEYVISKNKDGAEKEV